MWTGAAMSGGLGTAVHVHRVRVLTMCREEVMTESKPVELLRDRQGIYGIGVSDVYDIEALAWACGVDPRDTRQTERALIFRPDMLQFGKQCHFRSFAVLQKITGGFRHGMFTHSREERLRQFVHHEALIRAGLPWPPPRKKRG
jgi:hypothetical protein